MGSKWIDGKLIGNPETSNSLYDVTCDWLERTPIQGSVYGSTNDEKNVDDAAKLEYTTDVMTIKSVVEIKNLDLLRLFIN